MDGSMDRHRRLKGQGGLLLGDDQGHRETAVKKRYRHTLHMRSDGHIRPIWSKCSVVPRNESCWILAVAAVE